MGEKLGAEAKTKQWEYGDIELLANLAFNDWNLSEAIIQPWKLIHAKSEELVINLAPEDQQAFDYFHGVTKNSILHGFIAQMSFGVVQRNSPTRKETKERPFAIGPRPTK